MKRMRLDKNSITYKITVWIIILVVAQAILLSAFLGAGGVFSQARNNAYTSFSEKVKNRNEYIEKEMMYRWTNLDVYSNEIGDVYSENEATAQFFDQISEYLISMMRATQTTGAFVILNQCDQQKKYPALYIRDYDPILNHFGNKDLYMIFGPSEIANRLKIPLDHIWSNKIPLNEMNRRFFDKPLLNATKEGTVMDYGYWSIPFSLMKEDIPVLLYSIPLRDKANKVIGVIGVEISVQYLTQYLPSTDLQGKDSMGYLIGYKNDRAAGMEPVMYTRAIQKQLFKSGKTIEYSVVDSKKNIFRLKSNSLRNKIYFSMDEIELYNNNTPFQREQWFLIGVMKSSSLLSYVHKIQNSIMISLLSSILVGIFGGYLVSYRLTKPVLLLARKVKRSNLQDKIQLEKTGLTEVDELSLAIQTANDSLLESAMRISQIIDLAGVPIGAYEYQVDSNYVFVTEQLGSILSILPEELEVLKGDKLLFQEKLSAWLSYPEEEEEQVYLLPGQPEKWVRLKEVMTERSTIGVLMDVTEEIHQKKDIIRERDFDYLTQIYNRNAFNKKGNLLLSNRNKNMEAAVFMFDLDNLKRINDAYGHELGDKYIKRAVKYMKYIDQDKMTLGRRSGDEFVMILHDYVNRDAIRSDINQFYRNLEEHPLHLPDGTQKRINISAGLVWVNDYKLTLEEYLQYADQALYYAKNHQKGSCCEYGSDII